MSEVGHEQGLCARTGYTRIDDVIGYVDQTQGFKVMVENTLAESLNLV